MSSPLPSVGEEISADNVSRYLGDGRWNWTVFIRAAEKTLHEIDCVEYTLHPTFPKPVQQTCAPGDPRQPFALSANGWGEFQIRIRVFRKDGGYKDLTHNLKLSK